MCRPVPVVTLVETGVVTESQSSQQARVTTPEGLPGLTSRSTTSMSMPVAMAQLARGHCSAHSAICEGSLVAAVRQDVVRWGCLPALLRHAGSPHSQDQVLLSRPTPKQGKMGPYWVRDMSVLVRAGRARSARLNSVI